MDYLLFGNIQEWNNVKNPGEIKPKTTLKSTILAKFRVFKGSEKIPHFVDVDFFLSGQYTISLQF